MTTIPKLPAGIAGAYSINNSVFDIGVMILFGAVGYLLKKYDYEAAPSGQRDAYPEH